MSDEGKCRSCGELVLWATMVKADGTFGKLNCLNSVPSHDGNILRKRGKTSGRWYARVVRPDEREKFGPLYTSHFATCPQASKWRSST